MFKNLKKTVLKLAMWSAVAMAGYVVVFGLGEDLRHYIEAQTPEGQRANASIELDKAIAQLKIEAADKASLEARKAEHTQLLVDKVVREQTEKNQAKVN
jgi:hypothetical protein